MEHMPRWTPKDYVMQATAMELKPGANADPDASLAVQHNFVEWSSCRAAAAAAAAAYQKVSPSDRLLPLDHERMSRIYFPSTAFLPSFCTGTNTQTG